jgi:hypothetical protein
VRLVARHQRLRAEAAQGAVEVTEPGGEYVLRLVDGPEVEFRCAVEQIAGGGTVLFRGASSAWMLLVRGDEEIPLWPELALDGRLRAGGFAPGRYTIVVRVGSGAPVVLPDVDLQDGVTDLGELRPPKGAALRLRLAVPAGQAAPALRVTVTRTSAPRYAIEFLSKGETEIVVPGLGAGRFEVVARRASQRGGDVLRRTVDCDGLRDVVIDSSPR